MSFALRAPRIKERHHMKEGLQLPAPDNAANPRPSKKRRRDETEAEIVATEDKKERKRRKKEEKAKQRALKEDIRPISPVKGLEPVIKDTLWGEDKKVKNQKDGRKVEEPIVEVTAIQGTESKKKKKKKNKKRKVQMISGQSAGELQVGLIQEPANETNGGKNGQRQVKPADISTELAKNEATKPSPDNSNEEQEVEETLKLSGLPVPDALRINRGTTDEDISRAAGISPSKSAQDVLVIDAKPLKRRVIREGDKKRASHTTTISSGPEAQLASKWLNSAQVRQLEKDTGIIVKRGKFTTGEEVAVRDALDSFREANGLSQENVVDIIHSGQKAKYKGFWHDLTAAVPLRPMAAVYSHCKRVYHPLAKQGKWTKEEDEKLLAAIVEIGYHWEKVSTRVGRFATDCRDRYKNHLSERNTRNTGAWTEAEEQELIRIVREVQEDQGKDYGDNNDILWSTVSARMGGRRGKQQVRDKWLNQLHSRVQNDTRKLKWTNKDSVILLRRLAALKPEDESEINWNALSDNDWSAHVLQRHWVGLKRSVKGHEDRTFSEILKMVTVKREAKLGRKRATRDSTSKNRTRSEDKEELTLSKDTIENSDEELAELHHGGTTVA